MQKNFQEVTIYKTSQQKCTDRWLFKLCKKKKLLGMCQVPINISIKKINYSMRDIRQDVFTTDFEILDSDRS